MRVAGQCFSLGGFWWQFWVGFACLVLWLFLAFRWCSLFGFLCLVSVWVCGVCKLGGFRVFFSFVGRGALAVFLVAFPNPSFKRDWLKPAP